MLQRQVSLEELRQGLASYTEADQLIRVLVEKSLIVPIEFSEQGQLENTRDPFISAKDLSIMYLLLTDDCNLRCRYCFLDSPEKAEKVTVIPPQKMSLQIARTAIDTFARLTARYGDPDQERFIQLYGGEPTLNWAVLQAAVEYISGLLETRSLPEKTSVVLITNGTLITPQRAKFLAEHEVSVGVSIDGDQLVTDAYRIDVHGKGVYGRVRKCIALLRNAGVQVGLSCTLTPEALTRFDEILDHLVNEIGVPEGLGFNMLHFSPTVPVSADYYERAADCLIRAYTLFRQRGIYEERMMRKTLSFVNKELLFADCGVAGNQIVVAPDGSIGACQDFVKPRKYFSGSVLDSSYDPYDEDNFKEWKNRSPLCMSECFDCPALAVCGGGCGASAELQYGSKWQVDKRICPHSLRTLEWMVWDLFESLAVQSPQTNQAS